MLKANPFPQNILAALDALAELGKAAQDKTKAERAIHLQEVDEEEKSPTPKETKLKNNQNNKRAGK